MTAILLIGCAAATNTPTSTVSPTATTTVTPTATLPPTIAPTISETPNSDPTATIAAGAERLRVEVVAKYPHDIAAFTEGLIWHEGRLFESGGYYSISLREVNPETGEVLRLRSEEGDHFGEGIALVGEEIILLTWQEGTAYRYHRDTFEPRGTFTYSGEGWGLCYDGSVLHQSDGSAAISQRDPQTFELLSSIHVTLDGQPLAMLNELECVGDSLYANVWMTSNIVRIDKATGVVTALIDASGLLLPEETPQSSDGVLNGIAYIPERDTFLITGKWWPWVFEVRFVPTGG